MHALPAYMNGVGGGLRGRSARDEGEKLDVLNVLMRNSSLVRDARYAAAIALGRLGLPRGRYGRAEGIAAYSTAASETPRVKGLRTVTPP
jgi:hypothetical protein